MSETEFNNIQKATIILICSLFLCLLWWVLPSIDWTIPFYDSSTGHFSRNPKTPLTFDIIELSPYISIYISGMLYVWAFHLTGKMKMPVLGNIWLYYVLFDALKLADMILSFNQTPFRALVVLAFSSIQITYLIYSSKKVIKHH